MTCRNRQDFIDDIHDQYKEMRDEFMAGLEDRKYLTIDQVRGKAPQVIYTEKTGKLRSTEQKSGRR